MNDSVNTIYTWFERVWANEDEEAIREMLVPDTTADGLGKATRTGPDEFIEFHRCLLKLIGNVEVVVDRRIQDGDWHSILVTLNARRRDNGEAVSTTGNVYCRIVDGKIVEAYNHFDFMKLFEQIDLLPCDTLECCLTGNKPALS